MTTFGDMVYAQGGMPLGGPFCAYKTLLAASLTSNQNLFTITGGPVKILEVGALVTTVLPAGANTLKVQTTPTGGSATDLCGATDTASAAAQALLLVDGTKATALVKNTDTGIIAAGQALHMPLILSPGTIRAVFSAGPPATGQLDFFIEWEPLHPSSVLAAV